MCLKRFIATVTKENTALAAYPGETPGKYPQASLPYSTSALKERDWYAIQLTLAWGSSSGNTAILSYFKIMGLLLAVLTLLPACSKYGRNVQWLFGLI